MKKAMIIISILLAAVLLSAGSFWGGMQYQANKASQARENFFSLRGQVPEGQIPGGGQFQFRGDGQVPGDRQGMGFVRGGGAVGQIKSIDGNVLQLSTAENVTTVNLTPDTRITKTEIAALSELEPGMRISVIGQSDSKGNVTAMQIMIVDEAISNLPLPSDTQIAP